MANITWMNVPIPDIGSTRQQGIRTAADLFNRATSSATAGVAGLQAVQDAEKAAQVQAADRFVLERMLSTQDPTKYDQMRADGSLLGPAADQASNAILLAAEQRGNQLYAQDRERNRNLELQAAEKIWDEAVKHATNDPNKAQAILSGARFTNAEDSAAFAHKARQLFVPPDKTGNENARKESLNRAAYALAERVMSTGNMTPESAAKILSEEPDHLVRGMAIDRLNQLKQDTFSYYGSAPAMNPTSSGRVLDGAEEAQYLHFGNNRSIGMRAAGPSNPPPGSPEWSSMNGGRTPTQADIIDWGDTYVLPGSEAERGKGKGTTAIGPAQIVNKTRGDIIERFGRQLFGTNDPSRIPFTLENEEKIAEQIYKTQKAKAWQATQKFAGLKDPGAFEGVGWDEAKPLLYYIESGVAPKSFGAEIKQLEARLQERERGLSEGAKVILNAREKQNYGLNEAATDVAKALGKDAKIGDIREVVERTVRKAKNAGTVITHAEAAGLLLNAISDDGDVFSFGIFAGKVPTVSDLRSDLDLRESKLVQSAKDLGNARADLESHERNVQAFKKVQELAEQYKKDRANAESQLTQAKQHAKAGGSAIAAFSKWQGTSDRLRKLVAPRTGSGVNTSLVEDARPAQESTVQAARPPDIDLMLAPQQTGPTPRPLSSRSFMAR